VKQNAVGKSRTVTDQMDPARAQAFDAVIGGGNRQFDPGLPLPAFWHLLYFWEIAPTADMGRDGHPKTGGFIPDTGLPRRMWAGGRLELARDLTLGVPARKHTTIKAVTPKTGRSGPLAIVTLAHDFFQNEDLCFSEEQLLVYRRDPVEDAPEPESTPAPRDETHKWERSFSAGQLFRYSALTFNGHRIHYDREYCRSVEGYRGIVVHGPLLAQTLFHLAQSVTGPLASFRYRAVSPLFDDEAAAFCARREGDGVSLWVRAQDGRTCMTASASAARA